MEFCDIANREQLEAYYLQENLDTVKKKVECLKTGMAILAIRSECDSDDEELLICLEDYLFNGVWRAYVKRSDYFITKTKLSITETPMSAKKDLREPTC